MVPGLPVAARNIEASALLVMLGCYSLGGVLPSVASVRGAGPCSAMSVSPPWSCRGSLPQAAPTPPSSVLTLYRGSSSSLGDATLPYKGKHVDGDRRGEGAAMALTSPVTPQITAASPLPPLSSARHPRWPSADTPVAVQGPFPRFGLRRADLSPWGTVPAESWCVKGIPHILNRVILGGRGGPGCGEVSSIHRIVPSLLRRTPDMSPGVAECRLRDGHPQPPH